MVDPKHPPFGPGIHMRQGTFFVIDLMTGGYLATGFKTKGESIRWMKNNHADATQLDWGKVLITQYWPISESHSCHYDCSCGDVS